MHLTVVLLWYCVLSIFEPFFDAVSEAYVGRYRSGVAHSLGFLLHSRQRTLSIGFWEGKPIVCMTIIHCGRDGSRAKSYVDLTSRLVSAVFGVATFNSCGGATEVFLKALDRSSGRKAGVQYAFTLNSMQFDWLLHKPSFRVMGRIDMLITLRTLLLRLDGLLDKRWVQPMKYFRKVSFGYKVLLFP